MALSKASRINSHYKSFTNLRNYIFTCTRNNSTEKLDNEKNSTKNETNFYDIIIVGGGLVGTAAACAISKNNTLSNKRILLLESAPRFKGFVEGNYSNRVSALNQGTVDLMKEINAWNTITSKRYQPVKHMQVWDASSNAFITFNYENFEKDIAYIVENDLILHSIYQELEKTDVKVKNQSKIEKIELPKNKISKSVIELQGGEKFSCELLIGADGANSLVRKQMGVESYAVSYNQMGLVATLEIDECEDNTTAWQRFLPTGPVALLPLNKNTSSLVWSTTPEHAKRLLTISTQEFVDSLNEAFIKQYPQDNIVKNFLSIFESVTGSDNTIRQYPPQIRNVADKSRACFPLGFGHSSSYVKQGVVLIGDAAHRVHPLAGQGVNLGFGDVKSLTKVLSNAVYSGFSLGDKNNLLTYERERLIKNVPIMFGIHGLQFLYSTTFVPVVLLRSLGLQIVHKVSPLKTMFMERAMG